MATTYLLLGSNLGLRKNFLQQAAEQIKTRIGQVIHYSGIYETAAWGLENQAAFLNQVLAIDTSLPPDLLLPEINAIEADLGRVRDIRWGARVIDIDILFYENLVIHSQRLTIPHPELQNRRFTLVPLAEITPEFIHPVFGKTISQLLENCPDKLTVTLFESGV